MNTSNAVLVTDAAFASNRDQKWTSVGYAGPIIIEHEDNDFESTDELLKRGFLMQETSSNPISTSRLRIGQAVGCWRSRDRAR